MANSSGLHGDGKAIRTYTDGKGHTRIDQDVEVEHESCLTTKDCSATMELPPSHCAENLLPFPLAAPRGTPLMFFSRRMSLRQLAAFSQRASLCLLAGIDQRSVCAARPPAPVDRRPAGT